MLQLVEMHVESALFFESAEEIYSRVFRTVKPRTALPTITVRFRRYANANSRIRLQNGNLTVDISDLLQVAPAPIQEALAFILLSKLFQKAPDSSMIARYRRYLNRIDVRRTLHRMKQERGRKAVLSPSGAVYDLCEIFEELNLKYFHGLMARPELGWSVRVSKSTLGHYDPSHNVIVLTNLLDCPTAPALAVRYVMFHEMLHLRFPTQHKESRRCVHTAEFKNAERLFENFEEAKRQLNYYLETRR